MQIRWSPAAAEDIEQIFNYIRTDGADTAQRVAETVYDRASTLGDHPYQGRPGRILGTRELALPPLPFIIIYRVRESDDVVEIVNIVPGAQRCPSAS